ncbi:MAG: universal stress protein [Thermodesulfobacteriota bacterium]
MERKILVAVDKSRYCRKILTYLCELYGQQAEIKFHLLSIVSHSISQNAKDLLDQNDLMSTVDNAARKRFIACKSHMAKAKKELLACGFAEEQLETSVRFSRQSVVGDILHEAQRGLYDAIIIGKKDLSRLERMVVGSVSAEILKKNNGLPIWIVNGDIKTRKILVPVDCSLPTLTAIDHLAFIVKDNPQVEITLFHSCSLLASEQITPKEHFYARWGKEWCDEHLQGDNNGHFHFSAPEQILKEAGVPPERIHRLKSKSGVEPGQMIVHHVKKGSFGTIVMGRRHKDVSKGIFQGVSDRVLANISDVAIWIVG